MAGEDNQMKRLLPLVILSALVTPAAAEISANKLLADFKVKDTTVAKLYLRGLSDAFGWSNTALIHDGSAGLYCPPSTIVLTDDQELDILRRFVEAKPNLGTSPVGMVLLLSLKDAFPCP
jgi:hypothetical protein